MANKLSDLVIDEVSLVRKGANQHAKVTIAKSYDGGQEGQDMLFDEDGNPVDIDQLEEGQVVYDEEGSGFVLEVEDEDDFDEELEPVGKSYYAPVNFREEFSKALTDEARDEVISKALHEADRMAEVAKAAAVQAQHERETRIFGQYYEVAKSYSLPFDAEQLAATMQNVGDLLPMEDQEIIKSAFEIASDLIEKSYGNEGVGSNSDVLQYVDEVIDEYEVAKADEAEAFSALFEANPALYDAYLAGN